MPILLSLAAALLLAAPAIPQSSPASPLPQPSLQPIDPSWVYITPLRWVHAVPAAGIDERMAYATVLVLYPHGEYLSLSSGLIEHGREKAVTFSNFEGLELRRGTWSRLPGSAEIRLRFRQVLKLDRSPDRVLCDPAGLNCNPLPNPTPGPVQTETCLLAGHSKNRLAHTIHCARVTVSPVTIPLSLADLENLSASPVAEQSALPPTP